MVADIIGTLHAICTFQVVYCVYTSVDGVADIVCAIDAIIAESVLGQVRAAAGEVTVVHRTQYVVFAETVGAVVLAAQGWVTYIRCTFQAVIAIYVVWNGSTVQYRVTYFIRTKHSILTTVVWVRIEEASISIGQCALLWSTEVVCTYETVGTIGMDWRDLTPEEAIALVVGAKDIVVTC